MSLRARFLRGGATLAFGQGLGQVLAFVRNIIVARLLTPEDVGLGATFWVTVALLQSLSELAADKLLIQAPDGDRRELQANVQSWQVLRGVASAIVLFFIAWPISALFERPDARWAFQCVALVPILRGFMHLDHKRVQRDMRFGQQAAVELTSQAAAVALAWPMCVWLRDYSAFLALIILKEAAVLVTTHALATRRFTLGWNREYVRRLLGFGWPLLVSGLLMFSVMKGDRLIIGAAYNMYDLGLYAVAIGLIMAPAAMLLRVLNPLFFPLLSRVQDDPVRVAAQTRRYAECLGTAAALLAIPMIVAAAPLLHFLYGSPYENAASLLAWLAVAQALRLIRNAPTTACVARADTRAALAGNLARAFAVLFALLLALFQTPLVWMAIAAAFGEALALVVVVERALRKHAIPRSATLWVGGLLVATLALAWSVAGTEVAQTLWAALVASALLVVVFTATALVLLRELRTELFQRLLPAIQRRVLATRNSPT